MNVKLEDYSSDVEIAWCPGCGNFGILNAVKTALVQLQLPPHKVLICSGIGQAPKLPHYMKVNTFNGLHGREVAAATGAKLAADDLTVLVHAGEGGAYGEGGNHLLAAIRRNVDITLLVHDNKTYGLTKGQASPTSDTGAKASLQPRGIFSSPVNPQSLAISLACYLAAQSMSARPDHLVKIIKDSISNEGFSLINILQPCVSWDKVHTYKYYQEKCFELNNDYDPTDQTEAMKIVLDSSDGIPLGIIYRHERPSYDSMVLGKIHHPLRDRKITPEIIEKLTPGLS